MSDDVVGLSEELDVVASETAEGVDMVDALDMEDAIAHAALELGESIGATDDEVSDGIYAGLRERFEAGGLSDQEVDSIADLAVSYIRNILALFGEHKVVVDEYEGDEGELILDVSGGDLAVLIGRHGRTLDALQLAVSSMVSNRIKFHYPLVVDIEGYKSRRKTKLESLAHSAAARAKRQHGQVRMMPMNAYERRIVHLALLDDVEIHTHSEGEEPERRVVVTFVRV